MKVLDFIIISYYIFLRKAKQNQLEASAFAASMLPVLFVLVSLSFWVLGELLKIEVNAYIVCGIILFLGFSSYKLMLKYSLSRKYELDKICDRYNKYRGLFLLVVLGYFTFSIFTFLYSMRFLPHN